MRVALVVPDLAVSSGGPAANVPRLGAALARLGVDVELHTVGAVPAVEEPRLRCVGAAPAWPRRLARSPELLRGLRHARAELVHAHCLWQRPLGYAARVAREQGLPLVISPRGMLDPWPLRRSRLRKLLARLVVHPGAFRRADGWHATSEPEAASIRRLGWRQPICIAPNGIEAPADDGAAARRFYLAAAPELRGKRVLLFYSRFHSKKRVLSLLDDFAALAPARPDWHLLVVGLPEEYGVARLRAEAARRGLGARVTVLDGRDAPRPYALAQLFVLPTHDENFGRVVAEALAWGVPVVTTTGTPWEHLNAVRAGAWVELHQVRMALERLTARGDDELRAAGERGRRFVLDGFDWARVAARLHGFYAELLGRTRRGSPLPDTDRVARRGAAAPAQVPADPPPR
jgi:glycosyltransferase involved in cell wall biosynthesis